MRTDGVIAFLASALIAGGCTTASLRPDLERVGQMSQAALSLEYDSTERLNAVARSALTSDSAVRIALANNRDLRAKMQELGISRGQLIQAGLLPNPHVELATRRATRGNEGWQREIAVEYDITRALLTPLRSDVAQSQLEAHRIGVAREVVQLSFQVREAILAVTAAQQKLAVAEQTLDSLAAARDAAEALFQAGNLPELELASQLAAYEETRVVLAAAELELLERRERVSRLLGLYGPAATSWTVEPSYPELPQELSIPEQLEKLAIVANLDAAELRERVSAARLNTRLVNAEGSVPDVSMRLGAEEEESVWHVGGGLTMAVPIFDRKQGALRSVEAEHDAFVERLHASAIDVRSRARQLRAQLDVAHVRAMKLREVILPARRRVFEQYLLQYNAMQLGIFPLLEALRAEMNARLSSIEAEREFWTQQAALRALLAGVAVASSAAAQSTSVSMNTTGEGH